MPDHNEFFRRNFGEDCPDQMPELPNMELKMRIRLNQRNIPRQLTTELLNDHNMDLSQSNSDRGIFIVSGILPDNNFGEHEVMEVVRKYAPNAVVVPESSQRGGRRGGHTSTVPGRK